MKSLQSENSKLSATVNQFKDMMKENIELNNLVQTLQKSNITLSSELAELSAECRKLRSKLDESPNFNSSSDVTTCRPSGKKLLLGNSLIRDINPDVLPGVEIKCIRGGRSDDLNTFLKNKDHMYSQIILVTGSNDCSSNISPEQVVTKVKNVVETARNYSESPVLLSSICPRTDNSSFQIKAESVNAALSAIESPDFNFVNNDLTFRLQDGSINDGYLHKDGLHLSASGTERLARNLKLGNFADILTKKRFTKNVINYNQNKSSFRQSDRKNSDSVHKNKPEVVRFDTRGQNMNTYNSSRTNRNATGPHSRFVQPSKNGLRDWSMTQDYHTQTVSQTFDQQSRYCWFCGEQTHSTERCHGKRISCRSCGGLGHKEKMCWAQK